MPTVKDVVCGMDIDSATAAAKSEYGGETYYFCAPGCKKDFDRDPKKYAGAQPPVVAGPAGHERALLVAGPTVPAAVP